VLYCNPTIAYPFHIFSIHTIPYLKMLWHHSAHGIKSLEYHIYEYQIGMLDFMIQHLLVTIHCKPKSAIVLATNVEMHILFHNPKPNCWQDCNQSTNWMIYDYILQSFQLLKLSSHQKEMCITTATKPNHEITMQHLKLLYFTFVIISTLWVIKQAADHRRLCPWHDSFTLQTKTFND
jgi:hypothetical protein